VAAVTPTPIGIQLPRRNTARGEYWPWTARHQPKRVLFDIGDGAQNFLFSPLEIVGSHFKSISVAENAALSAVRAQE
jgi:hypothetical protein